MDSSTAYNATGRSGKVLKQEWKDEPRLYLGTAHVRLLNLLFVMSSKQIVIKWVVPKRRQAFRLEGAYDFVTALP